ncbi:unnamed protein product [Rotaria sp. Silwood2]|nr:unnamed protein product [Rotaria sp. Silwood2]CAF3147751.1 unnamed protein product [Rotaria sp. Silwood2]CAF3351685.1 unnamed protein product [Rotaria sp. Silwood2]CAF3450122.1 unnamed protein product [Rotaria sp. Silwood2]CAF4202784.1 unnamed protein product [Rotaria sp. Silwood2]
MTKEESPVFQDILFNSTAMISDNNEDSLFPFDITDINIAFDFNQFLSSFDICSLNYSTEDEEEKSTCIDQFLLNTNIDIPQIISVPSSTIPVYTNQQQNTVSYDSPLIDLKYFNISLSFINPPESVYHVRYLSEIMNSPIDGNLVNAKKITKKHLSGRYIKGIRGRYVTIALPTILSDNSNLFVRVTRLTVPYQDISFIHPYPLLYSCTKKKINSDIIIQGSSIYFKINKEEICSRSKHFPHLILTRLKQCHLKHINTLYSFDNNDDMSYPFIGNNVKSKIANYQLKKSQLDFRLVIRCEQTGEFFNTNIFCRSNPLLEEEGIELKKSLT